MFFELTELLTCPRCGPQHGLILLVKEVDDRRVLEGLLGCPACRNDYPIREGVADLRVEASTDAREPDAFQDDELAIKIAALSGLTEGPGYLMVDGRLGHAADDVADLLPGVEVVAIGAEHSSGPERRGVSRLLADSAFPMASYRVSAAAIVAQGNAKRVADAARVVAAPGRLVLFDAEEGDVAAVSDAGLRLVARERSTAVAERAGLLRR